MAERIFRALNPAAATFEPTSNAAKMEKIKYELNLRNDEIDKLKMESRFKDEDIFALRLKNAELKIQGNRKDEENACLQNIIENLL